MTNHEGHIKLWDALAKTGSRDKVGTFEMLFPSIDVFFHGGIYCFACVESGIDEDCKECPIDWMVEEYFFEEPCTTVGSPYLSWCCSDDPEECKRLAAQIRDLPWREK